MFMLIVATAAFAGDSMRRHQQPAASLNVTRPNKRATAAPHDLRSSGNRSPIGNSALLMIFPLTKTP
jgi:hypothetical protein